DRVLRPDVVDAGDGVERRRTAPDSVGARPLHIVRAEQRRVYEAAEQASACGTPSHRAQVAALATVVVSPCEGSPRRQRLEAGTAEDARRRHADGREAR